MLCPVLCLLGFDRDTALVAPSGCLLLSFYRMRAHGLWYSHGFDHDDYSRTCDSQGPESSRLMFHGYGLPLNRQATAHFGYWVSPFYPALLYAVLIFFFFFTADLFPYTDRSRDHEEKLNLQIGSGGKHVLENGWHARHARMLPLEYMADSAALSLSQPLRFRGYDQLQGREFILRW